MRILFTGGGTGGHLYPIIAVARAIKKNYPQNDLAFLFIGPNDFSRDLLLKEGIGVKTISTGKLRRYFSFQTIPDLFRIPLGVFQSLWHIFVFMPDVIFGKGGYGSLPAVLVSWLFRIPILLHESDSLPGLANRFLARFSQRIAVSFAKTQEFFPVQKTALIGNPIRLELTQGSKEEAKTFFNLIGSKPVLLVLGGSQGAQAINEFIISISPRLLEKYEIIHQVGQMHQIAAEAAIKQNFNNQIPASYHSLPFLDENQLKQSLAVADLIISRAGAGSIFEIAAAAKPSILIPLSTAAQDHQKANAFEYAKSGACLVIEQANLTPNLFLNEIPRILDNPELCQKMSECAKSFSRPEASQKLAEELLKLAKS